MKKYVVRLTDEERGICEDTIAHLNGSSQKAWRARGARRNNSSCCARLRWCNRVV